MIDLRWGGLWPTGLTVVVILVVSMLAWWLYFRESRNLGNPARWLLPTLRSLAILLALMMLLEPSCHRRWQEGEPASLHIVMDSSRSMSISDGSESRFQAIDSVLLTGQTPLLEQWAENHQISVSTLMGSSLEPVWRSGLSTSGSLPQSVTAWHRDWGSETAITSGLTTLVDREATADGLSEGSVLLFTDGQNNAGESLAELLPRLNQARVTVNAIGLGPKMEQEDLSVAEVLAPENLYFTDQMTGTVVLLDRFAAPANQASPEIELQIFPIASGDQHDFSKTAPVWQTRLITNGQGRREIPFSFPLEPLIESLRQQWVEEDYGTLPLTFQVRCSVLDGERSVENNARSFTAAVGTRRQQVLLLAGRSRWEMRFLRNSLERDPNWQVDSFLITTQGTRSFSQGQNSQPFPMTRDELLRYDLIVQGEIDQNLLPDPVTRWLPQFISSTGGGLLLIDGQRPAPRPSSDLANLLPVTIGDSLAAPSMGVRVLEAGSRLGMMQLDETPDRSHEIWSRLPGMHRVVDVQIQPGGQVLAELVENDSGQTHPYLVTQRLGAGRVLYAATDESWRWRYMVEDKYHQRFWNQVARWVMRRPFMVESTWVALDTGKVFHPRNQPVPLRVRLRGLDGQPANMPQIVGRVERVGAADTRSVQLVPVDDYPGVYQGMVTQLPAGSYRFSIQVPGYQPGMLETSAQFSVQGTQDRELVDLTCNQEWLKQLCESTGGQYVAIADAGSLTEQISGSSRGKFVESDILLWQSYWWFLPMVSLLGWEWWLRKKVGLV